jgi:two-component sensor histidine kinase
MDVDAVVAPDGLIGLEHLRSRAFDLVLLDLVMPKIDGVTLCHIIRETPDWEGVFIAVVSGTASEDADLPSRVPGDIFIAKRQLQSMKPDLEYVVHSLQNGERPPRQVLGAENLHQRRITKELLDQKRTWEQAYNAVAEGIVALTHTHKLLALNPAAERLLGVKKAAVLGRLFTEVVDEVSIPEREPQRFEYLNRWIEISPPSGMNNDHDVITVIIRDVTNEQRSMEALKENLEDRELMLREVHHRLKNNLLMVASYISLQIDPDASDRERQLLQTIRSNLESIALVHERLYRDDSLSDIPFGDYLKDVVHAAIDVYGRSVAIQVSASDDECRMEMNRALRLGLVVNELVMNALQHAFPDNTGSIRVNLTRTEDARAKLTVADDGAGWGGGAPEEGFGIQIVRAMVDQLGGTVSFESGSLESSSPESGTGTRVTIEVDCR